MTNPTDESYSVPALLRAIEERKALCDRVAKESIGKIGRVRHGKQCEEKSRMLLSILARAAELTASSASSASRRQEGEGDVQGWRLIESAPGGVRILAYWPSDHSIETVEWDRKWYKDVDDMPTHWQPLPEPPHEN